MQRTTRMISGKQELELDETIARAQEVVLHTVELIGDVRTSHVDLESRLTNLSVRVVVERVQNVEY